MKRIWFVVAILALAALLLFGTVGGVALAQEDIQQTILTPRYVSIGTVYTMAAYGDYAAVLHLRDDKVMLTYLGDSTHEVDLGAALSALSDGNTLDSTNVAYAQMAMYQDVALLYLGNDYLYAYSPTVGLQHTRISTTYDAGIMGDIPFTTFGVDTDGTVCVAYRSMMGVVSIDAIFDEAFSFVYGRGLPVDNMNYQMVVSEGLCYFWYADAYWAYNYAEQTSHRYDMATMEAFCYTTSPLYLYQNALYLAKWHQADAAYRSQVAVHSTALEDKTRNSDWYLGQATLLVAAQAQGGYRVYVADNAQHAIKCYDQNFDLVSTYGTWGAGANRLHSPTSVSAADMVAVCDTANERVVVYRDGQAYTYDGLATCLATAGNKVYIASTMVIRVLDFGRPTESQPYTVTEIYAEDEVISLCADGAEVYALSGGMLCRVDKSLVKLHPIPDATRIVAGKHAGMLYVLSPYGFTSRKDNYEVGQIEVNTDDVLDFDVDFCGNIYVLLSDGVTVRVYERLPSGYSEYDLSLAYPLADLAIDKSGNVYGLYEHALVQLALPTQSAQSADFEHPTQYELWVGRITLPEGRDYLWGYGSPNNYESIQMVHAGAYALHLADITYRDTRFCYVEMGDTASTRVYIPVDVLSAIADKTFEDYNVRYDGLDENVNIYRYPSYYEAAETNVLATVPKADAIFPVLRLLGVVDGTSTWHWYEVQYQGQTGYVHEYNYIESKVTYEPKHRYYARCVAPKLGVKIDVYAAPDLESEVVTVLVDGTRVEMPSPFDKESEWTTVRIDDQEYYILTSRLTDSELTNGQTFAIIMTVVVVLAAVVTVLLYALVRRKQR